ncbi:MAG: hypothetical protein PVJ10_06400 [Thiohalophilus sp.]
MTLAFAIAATFIAVWAGLLWWIRKRSIRLMEEMQAGAIQLGEDIRVPAQVAVFRGSDREFGNIKGTGVIMLTSKQLLFRKLTHQRIAIPLDEIAEAEITSSFKGAVAYGSGGQHLVIKTRDGNRIGFLIRHPERWTAILG